MEAVLNERKTKQEAWGPAALDQRRERARQHLVAIASRRESWIKRNGYYYDLLGRFPRFLVQPQKKVLRFHIWWISDVRKFQKHYPAWKFRYSLRQILEEIHRAVSARPK